MICLLMLVLLAVPTVSWAAPVQVTLFPTSALVTEVAAVSPVADAEGFSSIALTLPGQADPSTLRFGPLSGDTNIADVTWRPRQEPDLTALTALNSLLDELKSQRTTITAEQEGLRGRMAFWQAQNKPVEQNLDALRALAQEVGSTLQADAATLLELDQKLEKVENFIAQTEEKITQAAGHNRKVWEVTVLCSGQPPQELSFDYTMADCGWTPLYRLEAKPQEKIIDFSWQAKVWQRSGQNWSQIALHLATMQPDFRGEPGKLRPWEIQPRSSVQRKAELGAPTGALLMRSAEDGAMPVAAAPPVPQEVRYTTYAAWDMGQRSLPAGETRVFSIKKEIWPTEFVHLLRPSLDRNAYVQAKMSFDEPKDFPKGSAFFLIDGATVDQRQFALSDKESTMFFGVDPFLTCEIVLRDKKTGGKGLFKSKQTFVRHWDVVMTNAAAHDLTFRLEEPKPLARDERIKLNLATTPTAMEDEDDPDILIWEGSVKAGAIQKVGISLSFEAPEDLRIDPGWYW